MSLGGVASPLGNFSPLNELPFWTLWFRQHQFSNSFISLRRVNIYSFFFLSLTTLFCQVDPAPRIASWPDAMWHAHHIHVLLSFELVCPLWSQGEEKREGGGKMHGVNRLIFKHPKDSLAHWDCSYKDCKTFLGVSDNKCCPNYIFPTLSLKPLHKCHISYIQTFPSGISKQVFVILMP